MAEIDKRLGITPPISTALPSEQDTLANTAMIEELRKQNSFESPAETAKRYKVLDSLQEICNAFVKVVAREIEPTNEVLIKDARGKIFNYGSLRLGVFGPGSDIDTLVVAPRYVTREHYFKHFPRLLVEMAPKDAITDLAVVTEAFVPIIKFEYLGVSIDLIFSRIASMKQLPAGDWSLDDNSLLRGLDDAELRSLNGTRVTDEILALVPEMSTFKMALRVIKLWAQRRAIYGNIMAFPGGVAWAMMVARVCQVYPKACSATIVNKFFHVMYSWPWPQPVLLKHIEQTGPGNYRVWNPKRPGSRDGWHLMPVITPAYPSMCATHNITKSSLKTIGAELKRAGDITNEIMVGKRPWSDLFVKHTFFTSDYKYYISTITASTTKEAHKIWSGFVESKVRMLVGSLEGHPSISIARPFPKGYERAHCCRGEAEIHEVQDGSLAHLAKDGENRAASGEGPGESKPMDVEDEGAKSNGEAETQVYTTTHYIGIELTEGSKSLDLSYQVDQFKDLCTKWEKYDEKVNSLSVQHVNRFNLPDDLFEAGEAKPAKKPKAVKKRGATEDNAPAPKRQQTSVAAAG